MDLSTLFAIYAFVWGAMWGSFLNVVIYRVPRGMSVVKPRSRCPSCERPIRWWENIPLLSWVLLRGRCRGCGTRISPRYVLVELLTAVLSLLLFLKCAEGRLESQAELVLVPYLVYFYFICTAIAISFIDLDLTVVPDSLTIPGMVVGIVGALLVPRNAAWVDFHPAPTFLESLLGAALGVGFILALMWVYKAVTGRIGMGSGDATVLGVLGAFLGAQSIVVILFFASMQGIVAALLAAGVERVRGKSGGFLLRGVHSPEYWASANGPPLEPSQTPPDPPEMDTPAGADAAEPSISDSQDVTLGKTGLPFGPFLMLAGVEYLFFGAAVETWLTGGF